MFWKKSLKQTICLLEVEKERLKLMRCSLLISWQNKWKELRKRISAWMMYDLRSLMERILANFCEVCSDTFWSLLLNLWFNWVLGIFNIVISNTFNPCKNNEKKKPKLEIYLLLLIISLFVFRMIHVQISLKWLYSFQRNNSTKENFQTSKHTARTGYHDIFQ